MPSENILEAFYGSSVNNIVVRVDISWSAVYKNLIPQQYEMFIKWLIYDTDIVTPTIF